MRVPSLAAFLLALYVAAPAFADVTAVVKGGALIVKGDDAGSTLTIDAGGLLDGSVRITPAVGTTVNGNGTPQVLDGLTDAGAKITLGDGVDVLTIDSVSFVGKVAVKTGSGSDTVTIGDATMAGPTTVDVGPGDNVVQFCDTTFSAATTVKLGKGTGAVTNATCGGPTATTLNGSAVYVDQAVFGAGFTTKGAAGLHVVSFNRSTTASAVTLKNVATGAVCYDTIGGPLSVKVVKQVLPLFALISCKGGAFEAEAQGQTAVAMAGNTIAGNLSLKLNAGNDAVSITGSTVNGDANVSSAAGNNFLFFGSVTVTGNLVAKAAKGNDVLDVDDFLVNGDATLKYGDGDNTMAFATTLFANDLTLKTGKGDDTIDLRGAQIGGVAKIDFGKGVNDVQEAP